MTEAVLEAVVGETSIQTLWHGLMNMTQVTVPAGPAAGEVALGQGPSWPMAGSASNAVSISCM